MPLFEINKDKITLLKMHSFSLEKELQNLVEKNLETIFNCKFVATEFSTGLEHADRIDTLSVSKLSYCSCGFWLK